MWLVNRLTPDFKTVADFRRDNAEGFRRVCRDFVVFCRAAGLISGELVAVDGSKFLAATSRTQAVVRSRVVKQLAHIDAQIQAYTDQLETSDAEEMADSLDGGAVQAALLKLKSWRSLAIANRAMLDRADVTQAVPAEPEAQLTNQYVSIYSLSLIFAMLVAWASKMRASWITRRSRRFGSERFSRCRRGRVRRRSSGRWVSRDAASTVGWRCIEPVAGMR